MEREWLSRIEGLLAQIVELLRKRGVLSADGSPPKTDEPPVFNPTVVMGSVSVMGQPLDVQVVNMPVGVQVTNTPLGVQVTNTPLSVQVANTPLGVQVTNATLGVRYGTQRQYRVINASTAGDTLVVPAVSGKRVRVLAYVLVSSGMVTVRWRSGSGSGTTDLTGGMQLVTVGGVAAEYWGGLFETGVGEGLWLNLSSSVSVGGHITYEVD